MTHMAWQSPNWVDYSIIAIIVLSALVSLLRGFVREALALATWIVAFWIALHYAQLLASTNYLIEYLHAKSLRLIAAFLLLLITTLLIGGMINFLFSRLIAATGLSGTDRLLGMLFGVARGVLLIAVVLLAGQMLGWQQTIWWQNSNIIPHFSGLVAWVEEFIPADLNKQLHTKDENGEADSSTNDLLEAGE